MVEIIAKIDVKCDGIECKYHNSYDLHQSLFVSKEGAKIIDIDSIEIKRFLDDQGWKSKFIKGKWHYFCSVNCYQKFIEKFGS